METKIAGTAIMGLESGTRLFYTRIEGDKYYLHQPLTLSFWAKHSPDNTSWEQKTFTIDYVTHRDGNTFIFYGDGQYLGVQVTMGVKLMKYTPAAETLFGGKSK